MRREMKKSEWLYSGSVICSNKEGTPFNLFSEPQQHCHIKSPYLYVTLYKQKMVSLVLVLTLVTSIVAVDSATNITSCTSLTNDECLQNLTSCLQPPCLLSCGRTSPQQTCTQDCVASRGSNHSEMYQCDALECQALQYCSQVCHRINCKTLTCTAKDCNQECLRTSCGKMVCHKNATNCTQAVYNPENAQIMECSAKSCDQDYTLSSETFFQWTYLFLCSWELYSKWQEWKVQLEMFIWGQDLHSKGENFFQHQHAMWWRQLWPKLLDLQHM